jgi:hypothetical protein
MSSIPNDHIGPAQKWRADHGFWITIVTDSGSQEPLILHHVLFPRGSEGEGP